VHYKYIVFGARRLTFKLFMFTVCRCKMTIKYYHSTLEDCCLSCTEPIVNLIHKNLWSVTLLTNMRHKFVVILARHRPKHVIVLVIYSRTSIIRANDWLLLAR
jgi:hypothetical protein